ncbi:MAG: ribosome silencing factor [Nitrospina sp.]|jgi:ribosome-associated protein|nr:ribosome silencing factor [Nitrospina sp.]MBT3510893.1 ribosome silencing factor [Nitrospina sp.]MBT3875188.1 ribosome silencing factor [Nitrospina sp.]MBT4048253.1 ribosome silencing factor [Nitrospina sp.]MBT4557057.1 ribosome silencing factor [Nitrospina sp.]
MKEKLNALQQLAVDSAADKKAFDILILDLRNRSDLTDFFMICSGNSKVHVQSIVDAILERCYQTHNKPSAVEGYSGGIWIVVDLGDLIVHVFHKEARLHYDLERLWGDVPVIKAVGQ